MLTYEIKNNNKSFGCLYYFQKQDAYFIEIFDDISVFEAPFILDKFISEGKYTLDSYHARMWVEQRIVPPDRQNITMILKNHNLDNYDGFELLLAGKGRCAQDELRIVKVNNIDSSITKRQEHKIKDAFYYKDKMFIIIFNNGQIGCCNISKLKLSTRLDAFLKVKNNITDFEILPSGFGLTFGNNLDIMYNELYNIKEDITLNEDILRVICKNCVINSTEAAEIADCSRQNINKLTKNKTLLLLKENDNLVLKADVLQYLWNK